MRKRKESTSRLHRQRKHTRFNSDENVTQRVSERCGGGRYHCSCYRISGAYSGDDELSDHGENFIRFQRRRKRKKKRKIVSVQPVASDVHLQVPISLVRGVRDTLVLHQQESCHISCFTMVIVAGDTFHIRMPPPVYETSSNGPCLQVRRQLQTLDSRGQHEEIQSEEVCIIVHGYCIIIRQIDASHQDNEDERVLVHEQSGDTPHDHIGTNGPVYHDTTSGLGTSRITSTPHAQQSNLSPRFEGQDDGRVPSISSGCTSTRRREHSCDDNNAQWTSPEANLDITVHHINTVHVSLTITHSLFVYRLSQVLHCLVYTCSYGMIMMRMFLRNLNDLNVK